MPLSGLKPEEVVSLGEGIAQELLKARFSTDRKQPEATPTVSTSFMQRFGPTIAGGLIALVTTVGWGATAWTMSRNATIQDNERAEERRADEARAAVMGSLQASVFELKNKVDVIASTVNDQKASIGQLQGALDAGRTQRQNDINELRQKQNDNYSGVAVQLGVTSQRLTSIEQILQEVRRSSRGPFGQDQGWMVPRNPRPSPFIQRARIEPQPLSPIVRRMALAEVGR